MVSRRYRVIRTLTMTLTEREVELEREDNETPEQAALAIAGECDHRDEWDTCDDQVEET